MAFVLDITEDEAFSALDVLQAWLDDHGSRMSDDAVSRLSVVIERLEEELSG